MCPQVHPELVLLHTGERLCIPVTQEPGPMTEDMLQLQEEKLLAMGDSDEAALARAHVQVTPTLHLSPLCALGALDSGLSRALLLSIFLFSLLLPRGVTAMFSPHLYARTCKLSKLPIPGAALKTLYGTSGKRTCLHAAKCSHTGGTLHVTGL